MDDRPTFEQTYPRYEFSELVRIGLVIGKWILGVRRRAKESGPDTAPVPPADSGRLAG